ncbi:MAG: hypothetical protein K0R98_652 [Rickettsiaceae bacterium]|jgi:uncharacterized protein (UPF0262 family)|nr:hypothetical protein [Rickettsiaceae bacterium]
MKNRIEKISIDANSLIRSEKNKNARERAVTDLLENNSFSIESDNGPFSLNIEIADNKFQMAVNANNKLVENIAIPLTPLRRVIKDYHIICENYHEVVKISDPRRIEAIDMGRRGVHNEGAEILQELCKNKITMDFETIRKLFSLIYVLQIK